MKHQEALGLSFDIGDKKGKRHRRTATEIARHYRCPIEDCPKSYGYVFAIFFFLKSSYTKAK